MAWPRFQRTSVRSGARQRDSLWIATGRDPLPVVSGTSVRPLEKAKETEPGSGPRPLPHPLSSNPPPPCTPCWPPSPLHPTSSPASHAATDTMHSAHA